MKIYENSKDDILHHGPIPYVTPQVTPLQVWYVNFAKATTLTTVSLFFCSSFQPELGFLSIYKSMLDHLIDAPKCSNITPVNLKFCMKLLLTFVNLVVEV